MSKPANERRIGETEAMAKLTRLRTSPQKLNLVAQMIRGMKAQDALAALTFSPRRISKDVKKVLQSAIANAENNHQLDVDQLVVVQASVGKDLVMKRFRPRARGRVGRIVKPFSQITIVVREQVEEAA
jgi:large subunit ribosomal protein L22